MFTTRPQFARAFFGDIDRCRSNQPSYREVVDATDILPANGYLPMTLSSFITGLRDGNIIQFPSLGKGVELILPFILEHSGAEVDKVLGISNAGDEGSEPDFFTYRASDPVLFPDEGRKLLVPCWEIAAEAA
jgi:hypothetical protein